MSSEDKQKVNSANWQFNKRLEISYYGEGSPHNVVNNNSTVTLSGSRTDLEAVADAASREFGASRSITGGGNHALLTIGVYNINKNLEHFTGIPEKYRWKQLSHQQAINKGAITQADVDAAIAKYDPDRETPGGIHHVEGGADLVSDAVLEGRVNEEALDRAL